MQAVVDHIENWNPTRLLSMGTLLIVAMQSDCWSLSGKNMSSRIGSLRGNHEEYLLNFYAPKPLKREKEADTHTFAQWAWAQVKHRANEMASMPDGR